MIVQIKTFSDNINLYCDLNHMYRFSVWALGWSTLQSLKPKKALFWSLDFVDSKVTLKRDC